MGFTIILLHHTAKSSDWVAKGSTAIVDLADHILGMTKLGNKKDTHDGFSKDTLYYFGVREKTRFEPHCVHLTLNPDKGFQLAPDPDEEHLKAMSKILIPLKKSNKTDFLKACKELGLSDDKLRRLFGIGKGRFWEVENRPDLKNSQIVTPINQSSSFSTPIERKKLKNSKSRTETPKKSNRKRLRPKTD